MPRRRIRARALSAGCAASILFGWLFAARNAELRTILAMTGMAYLGMWACYFLVSKHDAWGKTVRCVTLSLSLLLSIGLLESAALLRLVDYRIVFGRAIVPWHHPENLIDDELFHIHRAHLRYSGIVRGDLVRWVGAEATLRREYDLQYDQNGFRNEQDYAKADAVVVGDSFIEGAQVSTDELVTTQMAEALELTISNLGQSYYGPQQELVVLQRFGVSLAPKVCFWAFFEGNDLVDVWRYRDVIATWPDAVAGYYSFKERSFLKNAAIWVAKHPPTTDYSQSAVFSSGQRATRMWFAYEGRELSNRDIEAVRITSSVLEEAYALCRQRGIQLAVVFIPVKFRVYADFCESMPDSLVREWTVSNLPRLLRDRVRRISDQIEFVDLTPGFQAAAKEGKLLYYADDSHWSPDGHRVAANVLSEFLLSRYGDEFPQFSTRSDD